MLKKIGILILVLFVLLVLAIAALPLWMPWLVSPVAKRIDLKYDSYERIGYVRFALLDATYTSDRVQMEAARVEGFIPTAWLWKLWWGGADEEYLEVEDWRVEIMEGDDEEPPEEDEVSVYEIFEEIENVLPPIIDWVPRARLGPGELAFAGRVVEVREATWREGLLAAEAFDRNLEQTVVAEGDVSGGLPFELRGKSEPISLGVGIEIAWIDDGLAIRGEGDFAGNRILAEAMFPREGYWPDEAALVADSFRLPREYLEVEGYEDVTGSVLFEWRQGEFTAEVRAEAEPAEEETQLPPLRVDAAARGDLESFMVEALEVHSPWLVATLSEPVAMDYEGELLTDDSVFQLAADLAEQPFAPLQGQVRGEVHLSPGAERVPVVRFMLTGEGMAGYDVELDRVELNGSLEWPDLAVTELVLEGPAESRLVGAANVNLDTLEIANGSVEGDVRPEWVARWLPEGFSFSVLALAGEFEGPVAELHHRGEAEAEGILAPGTHPLDAGVEWEGRMENLSDLGMELVAGAGRLTLAGATELELEEERLGIHLRRMRLERDDEPVFESVGESRLALEWGKSPLVLALEGLHWTGEGREIVASATIAWPERGSFSAKMGGLSTDLLLDFLELEPGYVTVESAAVDGSWENGPLAFEALAELRMEIGEADPVLLEVDARGGEEELRIDRLRATSRGEALAVAEGGLPLVIWPGGEKLLDIQENGPIDFRAETSPQAAFWAQFGELTGVQLEDPRLSLEVTGTPYEPVGHLVGSAPLVDLSELAEEGGALPVVTDLQVETTFGEDHLGIRGLSFYIEGQRVGVEAGLPMGPREWRALIQEGVVPDWKKASGRVRIEGAELAAFTRFAPDVLSPQGQVAADIQILPGGMLDGVITVENAATRPLMPFGSIREGTARLLLRNRSVVLEEISAVIGGERLIVTGTVDLPFEQPFAFNVAVQGRNLPLTRQAGVVIRGDLNLSVKAQGDEVPMISGRVDLHDSFYFAHIRVMPTGAVATPERRPPFFSIKAEPFNNWRLNVDLRGQNFLDVRGPVFQGELSANFNLSGTLEEPQAIGAAILESGRIRFPFAGLTIDQGEVALRREDPFRPQLFIVASGMAFGYDVRMEITGTAETPIIEFFSNPPLTSEQALLMVTTGELPREEIRFSTQQRASRFAIYFGQNLLYELTGDDSASDRLIVRSGEQVSEGGRETMTIEYRLDDNWSVLGEYDRFDEYNVGLKWNIYSR